MTVVVTVAVFSLSVGVHAWSSAKLSHFTSISLILMVLWAVIPFEYANSFLLHVGNGLPYSVSAIFKNKTNQYNDIQQIFTKRKQKWFIVVYFIVLQRIPLTS